jgi:hypothetical protein
MKLLQDFSNHGSRQFTYFLSLPHSPIHAPDLIGEDCAARRKSGGDLNLERVSLDLASEGTEDGEPDSSVISIGGKDDCGTPSRLLMPWMRSGRLFR